MCVYIYFIALQVLEYMCRACWIVAQYTHGYVVCCLHPPVTHIWHFSPCYHFPTSLLPTLPPLFPNKRPQYVMLPFLCPSVLIVQHPPTSENMWCLIFCSSVSLLKMMVSRFIHVPTNASFFMAAQYSIVYMCHIFLVQSIIDGHLGQFQVFAIVNSAEMNILCFNNRMIYNPLGIYPVIGFLGLMVILVLDP